MRIMYKKIVLWLKENKWIILLSGLCLLIISMPMFADEGFNLFTGDDLWYHLLRIENVRAGLEAGQFPVRMGTNWQNHYGYASSLCYPELFLYIPAGLILAGMNYVRSFKVFVLLLHIGTFLTVYLCGKGISKNRYIGLTAAIITVLSPVYFNQIYYRGAMGEAEAMVFFPLVIWGLYHLIYEEFDKPWIMGIGFWGLMFSHSISVVLAFGTCLVVCLFYAKQLLWNRQKMIRLGVTVLMVLLTTMTFWLPLLEQMLTCDLNFSETAKGVAGAALPLKRVLSIGFDRCNFGIQILGLCALRVFIRKKQEETAACRNMDWCLLVGVGLLYATTKYFPWELLKTILNPIQFPWRLYSVAIVFLGVGIGYVLWILFKKYRVLTCLAVLVIMTVGMHVWMYQYPMNYVNVGFDSYEHTKNTFNIGWGEWINKNVDTSQLRGERLVLDAEGNRVVYAEQADGGITFEVNGSEYYDVPFLWYKGYSAELIDADEETQLTISDQAANYTIRIQAHGINEGQIHMAYTGTWCQKTGDVVSLLSALICLGGIAGSILKKKK